MDRKTEKKQRDNAYKFEDDKAKNDYSKAQKHEKMVDKGTQKSAQRNINQVHKCLNKRKIKPNNILRGVITNSKRKSNTKHPESIAVIENDDIWDWEICSISESLIAQRKGAELAASKLLKDHQLTPIIIDSGAEADELPVLVIEGKLSELREDFDESTGNSGSSALDDEEKSRTETDASSKDESNDETRSIIQIAMQNKRGHTTGQNILKTKGDNQTKNYLEKTRTKPRSQNVSMSPNKLAVERKLGKKIENENEERKICSTKGSEGLKKLKKNVSTSSERNEQLGEMKRLDVNIGTVDFNYEKKETERIELGTRNKAKHYDDVSFTSAQMKVKEVVVNTSMNKIRKTDAKKTLRNTSQKPLMINKHKILKPEEKGRNSDKLEERANKVELSRVKTNEDSSPTRNESLQYESGIYSMQEEDTNNSLTSRTNLKHRSSVSDNTREATCPMRNRRITIFRQFSAHKTKNKSVETKRSRKKAKRKELQRKSGCENVNVKENENLVVKPQSSLMIARQKLKKSAISWSSASNHSIVKDPHPLIKRTAVQETDGCQAPPPSVVSSIYEKGKSPGEDETSQPDVSVPTSEVPRPSHCERREGHRGMEVKPTSSSSLKKLRISLPNDALRKSTTSQLAIRVQPQISTSNDDLLPSGDHVPERTQGLSSEDEMRQRSTLQEKSKVLLKAKKSHSRTRRAVLRKKMWSKTQTKSAVLCKQLPSETSSESVQPFLLRTNNMNRSRGLMRSKILQSCASLKPGAKQHLQQHIPKAKTEIYLVRNIPSDSANYSTSPKETTSTSNSRLTPKFNCDSSSIDTIKSRKRTWCMFKSSPNSQDTTEMEPQYPTDTESQGYSSSGTENIRKRRRLTYLTHTKPMKISAHNSIKSINSCSENETVLNIGSSASNIKTKSTAHLSRKSIDSLTLTGQSESKMIHQSSSQIECRQCSPYQGSKTPPSTPTFKPNTPVLNESHSQINCTQCSPYEGANRLSLKVSPSKSLSKLSQTPNLSLQYQGFLIRNPSQSMTEIGRQSRSPFPSDSTNEEKQIDEIKDDESHPVTSDQSREASVHRPLYSITSPCLTPSPLLSLHMNDRSSSQLQIQDQTMSETSLEGEQISQPLSPQSERISTTATPSSQSSDSSGSHTQRWKDLVANSQLRIIPSASHSQSGFRPCSPSCASYEQLNPASREDLLNLPPCKTVRRTRSPPRLPPCVNPKKKRRKVKRVQKAIPKMQDSSDPRESIERSLTWRDRPVTARDKRRGPYFTLVPFAPGGRLAREGPVAASRGRSSLTPGPIGGGCNGCGPCALAQPRRSYWSQSNSGGTFIGGIGPFASGTSSNKDAAVERNVEGDAYDKNGDFTEPWALFVSTETPSDLWQQLPGGECCCTKDEKPEKPGLQVIVSGHALSPECASNATPSSIQQLPSAGEGSESEEPRSIPVAEVTATVEVDSHVMTTAQPASRVDTRRRERWLLRALRTFDAWISPRSCTRRPPASSQRIHSAPVERSPEPLDHETRTRPSSEVSRIPWWRKMRKTIFRDKCKEK